MKKYPKLIGSSMIALGLIVLSIFVLRVGFNIPPADNSAATILSEVKRTSQKVFLLGGGNTQVFLNDVFSSTDGKNWKLISPQNATSTTKWSPRFHFGYNTVYFKDKIWVIGGVKYSAVTAGAIAVDVWSSTDGISWIQEGTLPVTMPANMANVLPVTATDRVYPIVFQNKIWFITYSGNGYNSIWSSSDGVQWVHQDTNPTLAGIQDAPWDTRFFTTFTSFKNKMWVLGGLTTGGNGGVRRRDIWSSSDGITWVHEDTDPLLPGIQDAPWDPREGHTALVFNDKLYILGGANAPIGNSPYVAGNDVWSSSDGVHWNLVLAHAPWAAHQSAGTSFPDIRRFHSSFVLNGKMFVVAGLKPSLSCGIQGCTEQGKDVWSSPDGINWTEVITTGDPISPRFGLSTVVVPVSDIQK